MDLFSQETEANLESKLPLAARMRPRNLDEFAGQRHFLAEGKLLRRLLSAGRLSSILFYGPPGTGKTTLARLLAGETGGEFLQVSAITSGVKDLREILAKARDDVASGGERPILFVDEIHRFNRSQQDALLPDVEEGVVTLVGATTSNPYFAINGALLSRSQVFQFEPLSEDDLLIVLKRALADSARGLGKTDTIVAPGALEYLATAVEGDARRALGVLEVAVLSAKSDGTVQIDEDLLRESMQQKTIQYDRSGDEHYDVSSALIKSIRGSDPDAALYWLARMLEAGEDVRFICRRLVILASEDIGNADPAALQMAVAAMQACEFVGLPECQLTLSQTVIYLALAQKSNAATLAIGLARKEVREGAAIPVPRHLRDGHYAGAAELGNATTYEYSHNSADGVADQDYLGVERHFFEPTNRGWEGQQNSRLQELRSRFRSAKFAEEGADD